VHEGSAKFAIGYTYFAAQVSGTTEYIKWNSRMYGMLSAEINDLEGAGYTCLLLDDFNGHVRAGSQGVPGNNHNVNMNWRLLQQFVCDMNLKMVNADRDITMGVFV